MKSVSIKQPRISPRCVGSRRFVSLCLVLMMYVPYSAAAQQQETVQSVESSKTDRSRDGAILVHGFAVTGNSVIGTEELLALVAPVVGTWLRLTELQQAADVLTQEYRSRGYTLAKAYLPEQDIQGGIVEIAVLEGVLGEIRVVGNAHYSSEFIKTRFQKPILPKKVVIEGHCDERGTIAYNLALSDLRANAVHKLLVELGVNPHRLMTISYGKERPFCREEKDACYQQNRRGHLVVKERDGSREVRQAR